MDYTATALAEQKTIKECYPELAYFYDDFMGNFCFTKEEALKHMESIINWMTEFPDFQLKVQKYNDIVEYYLTDLE